ncbi:hypothetical protein, partial [Tenacibaculum maritimum]
GSTLTWLGAVLVSTMTQSWDAVKNWGGWKKIGDAIAEVGRFFRRLLGGGKKKPTVKEMENLQTLDADPLARSNQGNLPSEAMGAGQADTGLKITIFEMGFKHGVYSGVASTSEFIKSLRTAEGWKNLGQGFVNLAHIANHTSPQGMIMRAQMGVAVNNYVNKIPTMSAYEIGYDVGYGSEKIAETVLVSKGAEMAINAVKTSVGGAAGLTNVQLVSKVAIKAERAIGGTGRFAGTAKHTYATNLLRRYQSVYGNRGLRTNVYFNGRNGRGFLDVLDEASGAIYDWKFGRPLMNNAQFNKYSRHWRLPIYIIDRFGNVISR